jgi:hypothetical protein
MTSLETGTPSRSFPLVTSPPLALAKGFQRTEGLQPITNYQIKNLRTDTNYFI